MTAFAQHSNGLLLPRHIRRKNEKENQATARKQANRIHNELEELEPNEYYNQDLLMYKRVKAELRRLYPGYRWTVWASHKQGVVTVSIVMLMGVVHRFVLKIQNLKNEGDFNKWIKAAGGEILERYRLSRDGLDMPEYLDRLEQVGPRPTSVPE